MLCRPTCTMREMVCDIRFMGRRSMLNRERETKAFCGFRKCSSDTSTKVAKVAKVT